MKIFFIYPLVPKFQLIFQLIKYSSFTIIFFTGICFSSSAQQQQTGTEKQISSTSGIGTFIDSIYNYFKVLKISKIAGNECCSQSIEINQRIVITGKCYLGPSTDSIVDSGSIDFCYKPINSDSADLGPCSNYLRMRFPIPIKKDGSYILYLPTSSSEYFILIKPSQFALQWFDGTPASKEPKSVIFDKDTIYHDFHFTSGNAIYGTISLANGPSNSATSATIMLVDPVGLVLAVDTCNILQGTFSIAGIPVGEYYLKIIEENYENPIYPNCSSTSGAQLLRFAQSGTILNLPNWVLNEKKINVGLGRFMVLSPAVSNQGLGVFTYGIDNRRISYYFTSGDSTTLDFKPVNSRYLMARTNYTSYPSDLMIYWYPGTFFRSEAETLSLAADDYDTVMLPLIPEAYLIRGVFPKNIDSNVSFLPILTRQGQTRSLGAMPYVDSLDKFFIYSSAGTYSLRNIPLTKGVHRVEGWSAFSVDSVVIPNMSYFPNLTSRWNTSSITGTIPCRNDFYMACFDTLNRLVSINVVDIYKYYLEKIGTRSRFFRCVSIDPKPFTIPFALNCLEPGKYAIAQVDLPDTTPAPSKVRWYGGQEYPFYFIEPDDLTLLTIPQDAAWITIDSNNQSVEIPSWTKTVRETQLSRNRSKKGYNLRILPGGRLYIQLQLPNRSVFIRILGLDGKVFGKFTINNNSIISMENKTINRILLFEVNNGSKYLEKMLVYR